MTPEERTLPSSLKHAHLVQVKEFGIHIHQYGPPANEVTMQVLKDLKPGECHYDAMTGLQTVLDNSE